MAYIQKDEIGLFFIKGLRIVRPLTSTNYKEWQSPKMYHFAATPFYGVGKDSSCTHGIYLERWTAAGGEDILDDLKEKRNSYLFYLDIAKEFEGIADPSNNIMSVRHKHVKFLKKDTGAPRFKKIGRRVKRYLKDKSEFDSIATLKEIEKLKGEL